MGSTCTTKLLPGLSRSASGFQCGEILRRHKTQDPQILEGKRHPCWSEIPVAGIKPRDLSLPPFARCWKPDGSRAHQVFGSHRMAAPLWTAPCLTRRRSSTVSPVTWRCKHGKLQPGTPPVPVWKKASSKILQRKVRSQLIKEGNFTAARALDFLVCGAINEPHLPADGSIPNQFLCVRCDQKVLATRKHELWECPGNTLINHTHMKESEHLTSLAQEFWDTDQVLFARGLLPRDWLPASEPSECNEVKMWESVDFSACAQNRVLFASDGSGKSRKTPQTLRQVAFGVATFDMHIGNDTSFTLQQTGYLGGQVPGKQTVPRAELWGAIQILSKVDGKSNIQIPIDAKYLTRGIAHRGDLVQGPNGDLWSILFQLIDERSGVTDFIKVKSHLEDAGPSAIKQNKIAFHHMLANSLADVVAAEVAKRLLPDLNLERTAMCAERVGFGVAKRLALVQADIWAKRSEAGDIYELDPLLVEETTCMRTAFSTLVDELAHQGHLLVRHNEGLRCKACNVYIAYKQFRFWSSHPCVPRPNAAAVISQFQIRKRQLINTSAGNSCHVLDHSGARNKISSKHDEKVLLHCTSLGYRDIQCTHSHPEHHPLPVSLEPELDLAHTHQCYSLSQAAEQSGESHHVLTKLHGYGLEGKRRRIASSADAGGPKAPLRSNFDDPVAFSEEECSQQDVVQRMVPVAGSPIITCGTSGCSGSCRVSAVEHGTKLGRSQPHVRPMGGFSRARTVGTHLLSRLDAVETLHLPRLVGQVWFPGATHRAIKRCPKVWRQSWRTARNLIRFGTIRWVNSLGIKWERQYQPLWAPARPASRCCILQVSRMQVNTPLSLVVSKLASKARFLMDSANLVEMAQYDRSLYTSARSLHKLVISELNRCL